MVAAENRAVNYGGAAVTVADVAGILVSEVEFLPHTQLSPHFHDRLCLTFVLQGEFAERTDSGSIECAVNSLIVRPPGLLHENRGGPAGARCLSLELTPARLVSLGPCGAAFEVATHTRAPELAAVAARLRQELRQRDGASLVAIEGLCLELLATASRLALSPVSRTTPLWLDRAVALLAQRMTENPTAEEIAKLIGVNATRLTRLFRARFGVSVGEYLRRLRVAHACRLLCASDAPLAEVASASGFYDQSHFTRVFRRCTGTTPAEYRRAATARR